MLTVYSVIACAVFLLFVHFKRIPEWESDRAAHRFSLGLGTFGVLFMTLALTVADVENINLLTLPILCFIFVHSMYTDVRYRKFDRHILNVAILLVGIGSFWVTASNPSLLMINLIMGLLFAALILFPNPMGASDARTLLLMTLSCVATGRPELMMYSLAIALVLIVSSVIVRAIRKRRLKAFFEKISIPMVPFLSLSCLATLTFDCF